MNPWDIAFFAGEAKQYPFSDVATLAVQVVSGRLRDVWVGDPAKAVTRPNGISILGHELEVRGRLMDEVLAARMWGPMSRPPFPNAQCNAQPRSVPLRQGPKKKHDPTNLDFRLISNQSSGRPSPTNDLGYSPKLIGFRMRPRDLQNILAVAFFGTFIRMFADDIEKCFLNNRNHVELLHLFVYSILTSEFGGEIFVDKSNPFW